MSYKSDTKTKVKIQRAGNNQSYKFPALVLKSKYSAFASDIDLDTEKHNHSG